MAMSAVVWEEPPGASRTFSPRDRSPERKEMDTMLEEVATRPGVWARLWDYPEKDQADKKSGALRTVAGRGWGIVVRRSEFGWSVYARRKVEPEPTFQ